MNEKKIATKHGETALLTAGESGPALLLLHGNSASKEVWRKQLESDLAADFRLITMDFPGHGGSSDAPDPEAGYCMAGYAETAIAVLNGLKIDRAMVVGWSLGAMWRLKCFRIHPALPALFSPARRRFVAPIWTTLPLDLI